MSRACAPLLGSVLLLLLACSGTPEAPPRRGHLASLAALPLVAPAPYGTAPLQGQVVLVSFIASWCVPCIAQLPRMDTMQRELGARGLRTIAVGMDLEGEELLAPFAEYYALPFPLVLPDDRMRSGEGPFGRVGALPTFFLFDRQGELRGAWEGMADPGGLERTVRKALEAR
jgi:thiol-disulfide isomerase/thioredoxin